MKFTPFGNIVLGNNDSIGIIEHDKGFTAVTFEQRKEFKTYESAQRFLHRNGYFQKKEF